MGMEGPFELDAIEDMIHHYIDTSEGQSGSALYIQENDKYYIIGVHVRSQDGPDGKPAFNKAVYLSEVRINRIIAWIKDFYKRYNLIIEIDSSKIPDAYRILMTKGYRRIELSYLSSLKLVDCNLMSEQVIRIAQTDLKFLLILNLSKNNLGDEGAAELSKAKFINLKELYLGYNRIGDNGAA